jgi:hypothetical protein
MTDSTPPGGAVATTDQGGGPGFLTPTPPNGGGGVPITPPAGGIGPTETPAATIVPTATALPPTPTGAKATRSPGTATPKVSPTATPYQTPTAEATDTPLPVASGAQTEVIHVDMPAPGAAKPDSTATVKATTTVPGAICTLTVRYRTGGTSIPQFPAETADVNGAVSWSWPVASDVVAGDWPVTVRCQIGLPLNGPNQPYAYANNLLSVH